MVLVKIGENPEIKINPLKKYHDESWHTPEGKAVREVIFGMNDGVVTTIGFIAGVTGTLANTLYILLAGIAGMVAGAISMAFGAYLSTKSQKEFFEKEIAREKREIREMPEQEKEEIREIYTDLGFKEDEVEMIVKRVTSDEKLWIRFMLREELGIFEEQIDSPFKIASIMGISFLIGAFPPLLPYFFIDNKWNAFFLALGISVVLMFGIGVGKTYVTGTNWYKSGFEILTVGSLAVAIGYIIGLFISHLIK